LSAFSLIASGASWIERTEAAYLNLTPTRSADRQTTWLAAAHFAENVAPTYTFMRLRFSTTDRNSIASQPATGTHGGKTEFNGMR